MSASYPPVGTRVRWTNRGVVREGVVVLLDRSDANGSALAFHFFEVFGFPREPRFKRVAEVVLVDAVDGRPRTRNPRYYHPPAAMAGVGGAEADRRGAGVLMPARFTEEDAW